MIPSERQYVLLSATARGFVLFALSASVLANSAANPAAVSAARTALIVVAMIWAVSTVVDFRLGTNSRVVAAAEAIAVGLVCGVTLHNTVGVLGILAVAPFTAGIYRNMRGALVALVLELVPLISLGIVFYAGAPVGGGKQLFSALVWGATGIVLGLVGTFLHNALRQKADPLAPYHYAQTLIRQLIDLSGGLDSGLDPVSLGGAILSTVRDELPTSVLVVHVPQGDTLRPLVTKAMGSTPAELAQCEDLAVEAWAVGEPVLDDRVFAFPLSVESGTAAVVAGVLSDRVDTLALGVEDIIRDLAVRLEASAVHLDTALLFAAFRDAATAEERRRLAREMHDGVAQDIASLGYVVDALGFGATSPQQAEQIEILRDRITAIVSEIRRSVVTLRTSVGASESLGTAIGSIARNLSEVSGVPIQVTLDERTARLRPEVEAELFRITQEAMNNAVKHAQASGIDVHCQVHAPAALITVSDNGRGLQAPRSTSHGMAIMRERATLINADLDIKETAGGGLTISVQIPAGKVSSGHAYDVAHAKIGA